MENQEIDKQLEEAQKRLQTGISLEKATPSEPSHEQILEYMRNNPDKVKPLIHNYVTTNTDGYAALNKAISETEAAANSLATEAEINEAEAVMIEGTSFVKVMTKALVEQTKVIAGILQEQAAQRGGMEGLARYISDIGMLVASSKTLDKADNLAGDAPLEKKSAPFGKAGIEAGIPNSGSLAASIKDKGGIPALQLWLNKADEDKGLNEYKRTLAENLEESRYTLSYLRDDQRKFLQDHFIGGNQ